MTELELREDVSRIKASKTLISDVLRVSSSGENAGYQGFLLFRQRIRACSGLRLVCRFEHVFSAPPHHVPVVDPRHRWGGGGSRLRKIHKDVLIMLKAP